MALPLAPPTLPDNIKVLASDKKEKEKESLEKNDCSENRTLKIVSKEKSNAF